MQNGIDIINPSTGEVADSKPYRSEEHMGYGKDLVEQRRYVLRNLRDPEDPDAFSKLSPDTLSLMLIELAAMYESLGAWLARQRLWVADLKTARQMKYNQLFLEYKAEGHNNEVAKTKAQIDCNEDDKGIIKCKHQLDIVDAWKKAIARYHDSARSQLSYEKTMGIMGKES